MIKKTIIVATLFLTGCIGVWTGNPMTAHQPVNKQQWQLVTDENDVRYIKIKFVTKKPLWWQLDTAAITTKSLNPWEKFNK